MKSAATSRPKARGQERQMSPGHELAPVSEVTAVKADPPAIKLLPEDGFELLCVSLAFCNLSALGVAHYLWMVKITLMIRP